MSRAVIPFEAHVEVTWLMLGHYSFISVLYGTAKPSLHGCVIVRRNLDDGSFQNRHLIQVAKQVFFLLAASSCLLVSQCAFYKNVGRAQGP